MNLVVDIGNSALKAALFEGGRLVRRLAEGELRELGCDPALGDGKGERFAGAIISSTRGVDAGLERSVRSLAGAFVRFDTSTPVPLKNLYATPRTLGCDRLAAAVGASVMFPHEAVLLVDFGTAITFDVVTAQGEYLGGNISPGARSRFRALHEYTAALPLCELPEGGSGQDGAVFPAADTRTAIESGVVRGIVAETESYIAEVAEKFGAIVVIFTGGDADYFAGRVKFPIFADSNLVLNGLNAILEHNANI